MSACRLFLLCLIGICFSWGSFGQNAAIQETGSEIGRKALAEIRRDLQLSQQQIDQMAEEIASLETDQTNLSEALIASVARAKRLENRIQVREERLGELLEQKNAAQNTLHSQSNKTAKQYCFSQKW